MAVSRDFMEYVLDLLSGWGHLHIKRMFGRAALYQGDLAFGMIMKDEGYLMVDDKNELP